MLPLIIAPNDPDDIKEHITNILQHRDLELITFLSPYTSSYFVRLVEISRATRVLALINSKPPKFTKEAMNRLLLSDAVYIKKMIRYCNNNGLNLEVTESMNLSLKIDRRVIIKKITKSLDGTRINPFVHMKLLVPYFVNRDTNKLYPKCVFTGSVNWSANGIENNEELLIILRDDKSIKKCVSILEKYWEEGALYNYSKTE